MLAQRLPGTTMPVLVRTVSDAMARRWVEADAATTHRDPLAEARALHQRVAQGLSVAAAGREFGLSRTDASHRLRLLRLAPEVREQVARGELAPGLARALVGLEESQQRAMADHIRHKRLTARQVEALVKAWKTGWTVPSPSVATLPLRCDPAGRGQLVIDFANLDIPDGVLERLGYLS